MKKLILTLTVFVGLFKLETVFADECAKGNYTFAFNRTIAPEQVKCVVAVTEAQNDDDNFLCHFSVRLRSFDDSIYAATYQAKYSCLKTNLTGHYELLILPPLGAADQIYAASQRSKARELVFGKCEEERKQLLLLQCQD